ncbi:MAG: ROK family transcriptional regulator [Cellulomonas sp.]
MTKTVQGTPSWLRATNDRTALSLLLEHGPLTRNQLVELTGLSKPTASQMVSRLEGAGLIHAVGEVSGGRGPNAASYSVRLDRMLGVAIDISGSVIRSTVVDAGGSWHPVAETSVAKSSKDRSAVGDVRGALEAACAQSGTDPASVQMVCIGVQGAIDSRTDELTFTNTLPGWPRKGVHLHLEEALGCTVIIDNDVNLAAVAERRCGRGAGSAGFALLWIGAGLGLAVDLGGTVHRGAGGGAGEIGYLPAPRSAAALDPAAVDLQDLIGGPAVVRLARETGLRARGFTEMLEQIAVGVDREKLLSALAPRIAAGLVPVLAVLDPEMVVLGGPTGTAGGPRLAELVRAQLRRSSRWSPEVVASGVPEHPVLSGAREVLVTEVRSSLLDDAERLRPQHDRSSIPAGSSTPVD